VGEERIKKKIHEKAMERREIQSREKEENRKTEEYNRKVNYFARRKSEPMISISSLSDEEYETM
jgi:hypothetical protein